MMKHKYCVRKTILPLKGSVSYINFEEIYLIMMTNTEIHWVLYECPFKN